MTLQRVNDTTIALKAGSGTLMASTDGTIKIGDHLIEGPGEYDIAEIGVHVFANHAIVSAEGMGSAIVWNQGATIDGDETSIDFLICLIDDVDAITTLIKSVDPRTVVFLNETVATSVATRDGISVESLSSYKVTPSALPVDSRSAVLLV